MKIAFQAVKQSLLKNGIKQLMNVLALQKCMYKIQNKSV